MRTIAGAGAIRISNFMMLNRLSFLLRAFTGLTSV
jgi:hypothetical protein